MFFLKKEKPEYEMPTTETILRSLLIDDVGYVLQELKVYKTKAKLCIAVVTEKEDGFHNIERKNVTVARSVERDIEPFVFEGHTFYWDYKDMTFRYRPDVDKTKREEINKWVHIVDDKVVWVDKRYAKLNLSPLCFRYSYDDGEGNYYWCKQDHSAQTVFAELFRLMMEYENQQENAELILRELANEIGVYAYTYYYEEFEVKYLIDYENMKDEFFMFQQFDLEKIYNKEIYEIED